MGPLLIEKLRIQTCKVVEQQSMLLFDTHNYGREHSGVALMIQPSLVV